MAELGLAVGVLSVIQLAAKVTDMAITYCADVRDALKQQTELLDQLSALAAVLNTVRKYAVSGSRVLNSLMKRDSPLFSCTRVLEDLRAFLKERNERSGLRNRLRWPLKAGEVSQYNLRIKDSIRALSLALEVEQTWVITAQ